MEPVLKSLANNFVTEGNSSDVIAVGYLYHSWHFFTLILYYQINVIFYFRLNTIREMCQRAPLIMTEDLLRDLVDYKRHRVRSVSVAAQSLIHIYRISMPSLLHKRDRVS